MYEIDPARHDLVEEFRRNPLGPYGPELSLVVNRLKMMPLADRHVLVCTKRGQEWVLARLPSERGAPVEIFQERVFDDYAEAVWEVFKRRWHTVTGQDIGASDGSGPRP